ncbi:MAG: metallophosphoesterase [Actinomycetota bacterium]
MEHTEARADLVRGLIQSCYVIEHARAGVQQKWGGDFDSDAESTRQRADRLGQLLDDMNFRRPDEVIEGHTGWFEGLCGSRPDEVALGAAVLHQFGKWSDVFAGPYLKDDLADFQALGVRHTRVEMDVRTMTEDEAFLPAEDLPEGRRFVILTDVHIGSKFRDVLARHAVTDINAVDPEFVVIPGDFTEDGEPEQFRQAKEIFDGLACPYYVVLGNHDAVQRSTREPFGEKFFAEVFEKDAADHVVECGDLQVALVDSTDPTATPFPDWDISRGSIGEHEGAGVDSGALTPGQAEALAQRLDKGKRTLLVQHHELHPFPGFPPVKFALREEDAQAELDALKGHKLVGVIAGHTHRSAVLPVGDGSVTQLEIPALKDWPFAYSVAGVTDEGVQIVARQVADRDSVWRIAQGLLPIMRRFALGPLSDLRHTFKS